MSAGNGFDLLIKTMDSMQVPGFFLAVSAVALVLILFTGGRKGRGAFFYPALLFALTILNPYVFPYLIGTDTVLSTNFYFVICAIPFEMICAYAILSASRRAKNKGLAFFIFVLLTGGAMAAGSGLASPFGTAEGALTYDISTLNNVPESKQIADYLSKKMTTDSLSAWTDVSGLDYEIRGYDPSICFSKEQTKSTECYITRKGSKTAASLGKDKTLLGSTSSYLIFKN